MVNEFELTSDEKELSKLRTLVRALRDNDEDACDCGECVVCQLYAAVLCEQQPAVPFTPIHLDSDDCYRVGKDFDGGYRMIGPARDTPEDASEEIIRTFLDQKRGPQIGVLGRMLEPAASFINDPERRQALADIYLRTFTTPKARTIKQGDCLCIITDGCTEHGITRTTSNAETRDTRPLEQDTSEARPRQCMTPECEALALPPYRYCGSCDDRYEAQRTQEAWPTMITVDEVHDLIEKAAQGHDALAVQYPGSAGEARAETLRRWAMVFLPKKGEALPQHVSCELPPPDDVRHVVHTVLHNEAMTAICERDAARARISELEAALSHDQLVIACKNIGFDLTCGACAALFYTGYGGYAHTCEKQLSEGEAACGSGDGAAGSAATHGHSESSGLTPGSGAPSGTAKPAASQSEKSEKKL